VEKIPRHREDSVPTHSPETSQRSYTRIARIAGLLYLIDFITAGIAPVHLLPRLIEPGNAVATAANIQHSGWILHLAVAGDLVTLLCEVALSALFYTLLRPVDRNLALLMAFFRLAYTAMVITNVLNLYAPLRLLGDDSHLTGFSADQRAGLAMHSLDAYHDGFTIALLFFGAHILALGALLYKSRYVPRLLGAWLMVASIGFFVYSIGNLAVPNADVSMFVVVPSAFGEFALLLLLLLNRVNRRPSEPAPADDRPITQRRPDPPA
jgi:hypothetical protein